MKRTIGICLAVAAATLASGCSKQQIDTFVSKVKADIAIVDSDVARAWDAVTTNLCPRLPQAALAADTIACIARANGTTQSVIAQSFAVAQQLCSAGPPPSVTNVSAISTRVGQAAQAAANAQAAGCQ